MQKVVLLFLTISTLSLSAFSQCVVNSSNGYTVNASICPTHVIVSTIDCPWSYNYNLRFDYNIAFGGINQPANLFTLQTEIKCNGQNNGFYALPLSGGMGTATTTTNPSINHTGFAYSYGSNPSCTNANLSNLKCNSLNLIIQGPGIPYQVVNCNCASLVLPVGFLSMDYTRTSENVAIEWAVESEQNNDYFTLLKSQDGKDWEVIKDLKSLGNTATHRTYQTTIEDQTAGNYYVKLAQTDLDGRYNELGMVYIENDLPNLVVAPNPMTSDMVQLFLQKVKNEATVRFVSLTGTIIQETPVVFENGVTTCSVPNENGYYFIEVIQNQQLLARQKVVKSH